MTSKTKKEERVVRIINDTTFVVENFNKEDLGGEDSVFVFGKKVDDFKTIDYDQIYAVGIGAIQKLSKELEDQKIIINSLQEEIKELKKKN